MRNLNHYKRFLNRNGYTIPPDPRDVVYRARALIKCKMPKGWRESFVEQGGVILHSPKQEKER